MSLSEKTRREKLAKLVEIEGYPTVDALLEAVICDSVSPAICITEGCSYSCEMEPDQDRGWCDECKMNTMQSALVLARLI